MTVENTLQVFTNEELNANIRVVEIDGQPFFVAKDVCDCLEIANSREAITRLDEDELTSVKLTSGGQMREMKAVNEYGLYNLILGSRKPEAKQFKRWITHDVLPSIRKTGKYEVRSETREQLISRALIEAKVVVAEFNARIGSLEETVAVQGMQIAEMNPKAAYYDMILNCKDVVSITTIAKDYGMSGCKLNDLLHEYGVQWKQNNVWVLYQKHAEQGYTNTKTHNYIDNHGEHKAKVHTYWTQKGRLFIYETLKRQGILPLIEREDKAA